jgi:hypothetical protein
MKITYPAGGKEGKLRGLDFHRFSVSVEEEQKHPLLDLIKEPYKKI